MAGVGDDEELSRAAVPPVVAGAEADPPAQDLDGGYAAARRRCRPAPGSVTSRSGCQQRVAAGRAQAGVPVRTTLSAAVSAARLKVS
ncbi:MAG: hypothetical protein JWN57_1460 [Frankiales bacterium]|jgi:hypothetical protein|nr:hypothetical protein [Frankiales bacterium]